MKMKILAASLGSAVVATVVTAIAFYIYEGKYIADLLLLQMTLQLSESEDKSFQAYENEKPEIGIWALRNHLDLIERLSDYGYPEKEELQRNAILTHARLGKLWGKLGDTDKERQEVEKSLNIAKSHLVFRDIQSKEALWKIVDKFDTSMKTDD